MASRISSSSVGQALARGLQQRAQLGVLAVLGQQLAGALEVVGGVAVFAGQLGGRLELAVGAAGGREALAVADHLGIGQLALELAEAAFDLGDEVVDHARECRSPPARKPDRGCRHLA